ncbi:MAG: 8-oxo-dGTP diphosphatase [Chthoniobacterales bacterium]
MTRKERAFWKSWQPITRTSLCFILRGEEILLIRKKRGIGAGKVNGPGGHLEPGESAMEAAIREVQEEVKVTPCGLKKMGELSFQFVDKNSSPQHCVVFIAQGFLGEPEETEEAIPFWSHHTQIPFDEMWADDRDWIPGMLVEASKNLYSDFTETANNSLAPEVASRQFQLSVEAACTSEAENPLKLKLLPSTDAKQLAPSAPYPSSVLSDLNVGSKKPERQFAGYYFFDQDELLSGHLEWSEKR